MAVSALVGIVALLLFISVSWPDAVRDWLITAFVAAAIGFLASASTAVFAAARDTYASGRSGRR